jgi:hypothetical protein
VIPPRPALTHLAGQQVEQRRFARIRPARDRLGQRPFDRRFILTRHGVIVAERPPAQQAFSA